MSSKLFIILILGICGAYGQTYVDVSFTASERVTFTSPEFPAKYENNLLIIYRITGAYRHGIMFRRLAFDLDNQASIDISETVIPDGSTQPRMITRTYTAATGFYGHQARSNYVEITLRTGHNEGGKTGFSITAESYGPPVLP